MEKNYNTQKAAGYMEDKGATFTPGTMEVWRSLGRGPRFKKIGHKVFYEQSALDEFLRGQVVETVDSISRRDAV